MFGRGVKLIQKVKRMQLYLLRHKLSRTETGISARQQGAALGGTPLPSAPRSIFEYIYRKDQERIQNIATSRFAPPSTSGGPSSGPSLPTPPTITHTEHHVAQAALHGFQLFMTDPSERTRYAAYVRAHANPGSSAIPPAQKPEQTLEEFAKEISDCTKSTA
ncbi:hypothetical protein F4604DRAFT_1955360 [Suillus subluteus]|nr:hypothetical protein F4604DRAFT_1955360 [Suillus subluteus]